MYCRFKIKIVVVGGRCLLHDRRALSNGSSLCLPANVSSGKKTFSLDLDFYRYALVVHLHIISALHCTSGVVGTLFSPKCPRVNVTLVKTIWIPRGAPSVGLGALASYFRLWLMNEERVGNCFWHLWQNGSSVILLVGLPGRQVSGCTFRAEIPLYICTSDYFSISLLFWGRPLEPWDLIWMEIAA